MTESIRRLPDAELEVMQALWACETPAARADIEKVLFPHHPMALTTLLTLLHRYFTFRATEKWFIALPIMLLAAVVWQFVQALMLASFSKLGVNAVTALVTLLPFIWPVLSYLLQRCVIYCHTTDTNGWYRRFHPTNDEGV